MFGIQLTLLLGILLLPLLGAVAARLLGQRGAGLPVRWIGGASFALSIACLVGLTQLPLEAAALGRFAIFLPSSDVVVARDSLIELPTPAPAASTASATPRPRATSVPTPAPTSPATPTTEPPTATPAPPPTEVPPPPTAAPPPPTEAPPPTTTAPRQTQRYVVEPGDTLRGIAERFDVSVDAILRYNGLSPEEGDSLRVGQELFIPPQ